MCLHSNYQRALYLECIKRVRSITLARMRHAKLKNESEMSLKFSFRGNFQNYYVINFPYNSD